MHRRIFFLIAFLIISALASAQTAYLWPEADPVWKTRTIESWKKNDAYSKQMREKIVGQVTADNTTLGNAIGLKFQKAMLGGSSIKKVQRVQDPSTVNLAINDLFVNLTIGLKLASDSYPYYKKGQPVVTVAIGVYSFDGTVLLDSTVAVNPDFKTEIKPQLIAQSPSEKPIEEYRVSVQAGMDKLVPLVTAAITRVHQNWMKTSAAKAIDETAQNRFLIEMNLLVSGKKDKFPDHYSGLALAEGPGSLSEQSNPASRSTEVEERVAYDDKAIASELTEGMQGVKYYGLFIGMQDYTDPKINDLDNPVNDATRLRNLLIQQYTFTPETAILLKNPTREDLLKSLDYLTEKLTAKDNLLIFYAGHGLYDEQLKSGFWLLKDATQGSRSNWISNGSLRDYIGGIKARHTLLVADACFSGGIFKTRDAFQTMTKADHELYKLNSRKAMTSGAMKTVPDQSVFIEYLLKRLGENEKTFLSSESLFASFKSAVINNSPNGQVPQFGEIRETGDEGGDFIFVLKR